ncbi:uncharacterized protein V1516DRAFT_417274 [Lipomyces oligophaga]|uniref:uncharacterized protein n=1 Tax=Lipomyces oligophaga TaxID=45792 RepID=UPI0034CED738
MVSIGLRPRTSAGRLRRTDLEAPSSATTTVVSLEPPPNSRDKIINNLNYSSAQGSNSSLPSSVVLRNLDRYPQITRSPTESTFSLSMSVRSGSSQAVSPTTPTAPPDTVLAAPVLPPVSSTSTATGSVASTSKPAFPRRQSSVRSQHSVFSLSRDGLTRAGTLKTAPAVENVQEESELNFASSGSTSSISYHTTQSSVGSNSSSFSSAATASSPPNALSAVPMSNTASDSGVTSDSSIDSAQVSVASFITTKIDSPRRIQISTGHQQGYSPMTSPTRRTNNPAFGQSPVSPVLARAGHSLSSSISTTSESSTSMPTSPSDPLSPNLPRTYSSTPASSPDVGAELPNSASLEKDKNKKLETFFGRTHSTMRRLHMPDIHSTAHQIKQASTAPFKSHQNSKDGSVTVSSATYIYELVETLQGEMTDVSVELASSIKRELDLEMMLESYATTAGDDELEELDVDDDSSDDSMRHSRNLVSDHPALQHPLVRKRLADLEKQVRSEQQEKARLRLEFQATVNAERRGRRESDDKRRELEDLLKVCIFDLA